MNLPAGSYKLLIQPNTAGYPDKWYGGRASPPPDRRGRRRQDREHHRDRQPVPVGHRRKSGGAGPLVGAYVTAYEAVTATWTNYDQTDATGAYAINLPSGTYRLLIQPNTAGYPDNWHGGRGSPPPRRSSTAPRP